MQEILPLEVEIRLAGMGDLPGIMRILNKDIASMCHTLDTRLWSMAQAVAWYMRHGARHPVIVARDGGHVAGYAALAPYRESVGFEAMAESSVYVSEKYRRRSLGRALLKELLVRAKGIGLSTIIATITAENQPSIMLHEAAGYERMALLEGAGRRGGKKVDLVLMHFNIERLRTCAGDEDSTERSDVKILRVL